MESHGGFLSKTSNRDTRVHKSITRFFVRTILALASSSCSTYNMKTLTRVRFAVTLRHSKYPLKFCFNLPITTSNKVVDKAQRRALSTLFPCQGTNDIETIKNSTFDPYSLVSRLSSHAPFPPTTNVARTEKAKAVSLIGSFSRNSMG